MKNTLIAIIGVALVLGFGYVVTQDPSGTPVVETDPPSHTSNAVPSTQGKDLYIAGAYQDFTQPAYEAAIADGKTVILDFHADWCPTCRANEPIVESVFSSNTDTNIVGFKVNYDTEIALRRAFNVQSQSTFIKTSATGDTKQLGPGPITHDLFLTFIQS